jgi:hypothetical protein
VEIDPYIRPRDFGKMEIPVKERKIAKRLRRCQGGSLTLRDHNEHKIVLGASGSGKTYGVLNADLVEIFRSTHLPPGPDRERLKPFGLILDPKHDFFEKTWWVTARYGRLADLWVFGPDQHSTYDLFGDLTESAQDKANKLLEMMRAYSGGKQSDDPFWDANARKLGMNIFILHENLSKAAQAASDDDTRRKFGVPPMSFTLLNLIMMDRGQARNQAEVQRSAERHGELLRSHGQYREKLAVACAILESELETVAARLEERRRAMATAEAEYQSLGGTNVDGAKLNESMERAARSRVEFGRLEAVLADMELENNGYAESRQFRQFVSTLRSGLMRESAGETAQERIDSLNRNGQHAALLFGELRRRIPAADDDRLGKSFRESIEALQSYLFHRDELIRFKPVAPEHGMLRRMLAQYEDLLVLRKHEFREDATWSYFNEEFLHIANERTAGSVGMTATSMIALFAHPPFSRIFAPGHGLRLERLIDEGRVLYMDIPARYGKAGEVAQLAIKIDFFRLTLARATLCRVSENGVPVVGSLVNQDREGFYFAEEFGTIATTGQSTGEASYFDKVREFRVSCFAAAQSLAVLNKRLPEHEVNAILSNTAFKVFLRADCIQTMKFASEVMGLSYKVHANLNAGAAEAFFDDSKPFGTQGFTTNYSKASRFDPPVFSELARGEAIVKLPPRFAPRNVFRVHYRGCKISPPKNCPPPPGGALAQEEAEAFAKLQAELRQAGRDSEDDPAPSP